LLLTILRGQRLRKEPRVMEIDDEEGFMFDEADVRKLRRHFEQDGKKWSLAEVRKLLNRHLGMSEADFAAARATDDYLLSEFAKVPHKSSDTVSEVLSKDVLEKAVAIFNSTQLQASGRKLS
jgi:hypothetical protein